MNHSHRRSLRHVPVAILASSLASRLTHGRHARLAVSADELAWARRRTGNSMLAAAGVLGVTLLLALVLFGLFRVMGGAAGAAAM